MRYRCSILAAVSLAVVTVLSVVPEPAMADTVAVSGSPKEGFARLKFVWPTPVPFVARILGRRLTIRFGRPA